MCPSRNSDATEGFTRKISFNSFASPAWTDRGSEVHRLGMVGNTLVQVEIDTLNMGQGPVRQTSIHVYEFRDGKRWRVRVDVAVPGEHVIVVRVFDSAGNVGLAKVVVR